MNTVVSAWPRIARPRLAARMRTAVERVPLVMCAEAGFGKTSALEEALSKLEAVAWVRCREADRDGRAFLLQVTGRLAEVAPGAVDVLAERLAEPGPIDVGSATADLVAELQRLLAERVVIAIDDAEVLADAPAALDVATRLLAGAGTSYGAAIATRVPLALKLAKLRAGGGVEEIGAAELAFSVEECAELLRARAASPAESHVEEIVRTTHGWPLGVALAAAVGTAPESRERLFDFLEQEVLDGVPEEVRDRLLASSVLPELEPDALRAIGVEGDVVDEARRAGLAVRPAAGGDAMAYHPLVRDFLTSRLEAAWTPARRHELYARAARALAAAGRELDAIDQWLSAERFADALTAIAALHARGVTLPRERVDGWLEATPESLRSDPAYALLEGHLAWTRGRHEEAVAKLTAAVDGFSAIGDEPLEWSARFALCDPLGMTGRFEEMAALADGFDSAGRGAGMAAAATGFYGAIALGCLGRVDELERRVARLLEHPAGGMFRSLRAAWQQFADVPRGAFEELWRAVTAGIEEYERADPLNKLPQQLLVAALILMDQGRGEDANQMWLRLEELAATRHVPYLVGLARAERARVHVVAGRTADAEAELARAGPTPPGWQGYAWELAGAGIAARRGRTGDAIAAADRTLALSAATTVLERERIALEVIPILHEAGAPARAEELAAGALHLLDAHYPGAAGCYLRGVLLAQRAWMHHASGALDAAAAELRRAWIEAGPNRAALVRRLGPRAHGPIGAVLARHAIDPDEVVRAYEQGDPGGDGLAELTCHPLPEVRRRAAASLAASGRPDMLTRLSELTADADPGVADAAATIRARVLEDPPPLSFRLFGGFSVARGSWRADDAAWERRVAQRLVRLLVTRRDTAVSEDELMAAFWADKDADSARRSLQVALSSARRVIDLPGADSAIVAAEHTYRLTLRPRDSVDIDEFERAAGAALAAPASERLELLEHAARRWGGEPLPEERYSDWSISWREALEDRYRAILAALVDAHLAIGGADAAVEAARRLVLLDQLNEAAHRALMLAYARAGRRAHALRQYLECRRLLTAELGLEPAVETSELQRRVLAGEPV